MGRSSAYETDFCEVCAIIQGLNHVHHLHGFTDCLANDLVPGVCLFVDQGHLSFVFF